LTQLVTTTSLSSHHPPTPQTYTLSLHDALPISERPARHHVSREAPRRRAADARRRPVLEPGPHRPCHRQDPGERQAPHRHDRTRSEEHTSELQSLTNLVCRLLLEKTKTIPVQHL